MCRLLKMRQRCIQTMDGDVLQQGNWVWTTTKQITIDTKQIIRSIGTFSLWSLKRFELKRNEGAVGFATPKQILKVNQKVIDATKLMCKKMDKKHHNWKENKSVNQRWGCSTHLTLTQGKKYDGRDAASQNWHSAGCRVPQDNCKRRNDTDQPLQNKDR